MANLRGDEDEQLFYASFFTGGGLGVLVCPGCAAGKNNWNNTSSLKQAVLDDTIGPAFDVQTVDLNNDGRLDLLVTNHVDNATSSYQSGGERVQAMLWLHGQRSHGHVVAPCSVCVRCACGAHATDGCHCVDEAHADFRLCCA